MIGRLTSIVSGAQAGAERGALDAAIELDLGYGGWVPRGDLAIDGEVPALYRARLRESTSEQAGMSTRLNIQDSDGTLMISFAPKLAGRPAFVEKTAERAGKAYLHIVLPAGGGSAIPSDVATEVREWIAEDRISVLHVAGPRENDEPGIQTAVRDALVWIFEDEPRQISGG